ncbi:MAG: BON domain-containing protein [Parvularculaceae bacterium]
MRLAAFAVAAAVALAACAGSRSLDDSFSDLGADAKLKQTLLVDREHDYGDIDITIFEGRLMLTGTMASEAGRRKLIENAWKAGGVDEVIDEVFVGDDTGLAQGVSDGRIDASLRAKLIADDGVRSRQVKIAASNGVVYLLGEARDQAELERVIAHARKTPGVSKVVSHVVYEGVAPLAATAPATAGPVADPAR